MKTTKSVRYALLAILLFETLNCIFVLPFAEEQTGWVTLAYYFLFYLVVVELPFYLLKSEARAAEGYRLAGTFAFLMFCASAAGHFFDLYRTIDNYDKVIHFLFFPMFTSAWITGIGRVLAEIYDASPLPGWLQAAAVLAGSLALGATHEIAEYFLDVLTGPFSSIEITDKYDTSTDLLGHLTGTLLFLAAMYAKSRWNGLLISRNKTHPQ